MAGVPHCGFPFDGTPTSDEEWAALALVMLSRDVGRRCNEECKPTSAATIATSPATIRAIERKPSSAAIAIRARVDPSVSGHVKKAIQSPSPGKKHAHECEVCGNTFPSYQALGGHKTRHRNPRTPRTPSSLTSLLSPQVVGRRLHECFTCNKSFPTGQALGGHMRKHFVGVIPSGEKSYCNSNGCTPHDFDLNLNPPTLPEINLDLSTLRCGQNMQNVGKREVENPASCKKQRLV